MLNKEGIPSLIMDLQLFAEEGESFDDDVILPDDFTPDTPIDVEEGEEITEDIETTADVQAQEENQEQPQEIPQEETQKIKIKYNHEEKELTLEEATLLAQKGMNYDKLLTRLDEYHNNPALQYLNNLAEKNGTTTEELVQYWKQQEEQQMINELVQKNIPEEYAREMIENRKFREQQLSEKKQNEAAAKVKEQREQELQEFINTFPDVKAEDIPEEVVDMVQGGTPLKYAYMEHQFKQLNDKVKILETNLNNKKKAPISNGISDFGADEPTQEDNFLKGFNSI